MDFNAIFILVIFILVIFFIFMGFRTPKTQKEPKKRRLWLDFGTIPILGVIFLVIFNAIDINIIEQGIIGNDQIHPYAIIILFFSLAYLCVSLDITGFFEYLALKTVQASGNSGRKLFFYFFFLASFLTIFTSNDIVILTLTPIICYFTKYTKTNPIPYLISQFFAANIWSCIFYIGNPTNIIVAEAYELSFLGYTQRMFFPTITAGFCCLLLLWFLFRKEIPHSFNYENIHPEKALKDKKGAIVGLIFLILTLITFVISPILGFPLWTISLFFALLMLGYDLLYYFTHRIKNTQESPSHLRIIISRIPWKIMPFIICMFILIKSLESSGWVTIWAGSLSNVSQDLIFSVIITMFIFALSCNIMNNQPMTILYTQILLNPAYSASKSITWGVMFALIMGSNFGANFTLIGALAGIMWFTILKEQNIKLSFKDFSKYGFIVMPLVVLTSALVLSLEIMLW